MHKKCGGAGRGDKTAAGNNNKEVSMGFFSRLFRSRTGGREAASDWSSLPESDASALVLPHDEANRIMARFDIDAAIATHERWLPWLAQALSGTRDERLQSERISDASCSELGQWLHDKGRIALGEFPAFEMLLTRHRFFHQQAAAMLAHLDLGEQLLAQQAYKRCQHASRQVVLLLRELQRGLARNRQQSQGRPSMPARLV